MEFLNFDLEIRKLEDKKYAVKVFQSPAGEAASSLNDSCFTLAFKNHLKAIELVRGSSRDARNIHVTDIPQELDIGTVSEADAAVQVGRDLFESIFTDEVLSRYRSSLHIARQQKSNLRVRLRIEAPELSNLPWEFLYDNGQGDHLNLLRSTAVTRYIEIGQPQKSLTITPPLRILGMVASPQGLASLNTQEEQLRMRQAIDHLIESRTVELDWVEGQSWRDLNRAVESTEFHILHFIGHGNYSEEYGEGRLAFVDEETGGPYFVSATGMGRMLDAHPSIRLAVINACEGARASENEIFSSIGAVLVRRGIPAVVSMQYAITDRAAIEFSRQFYDRLAAGEPVDTAVQSARLNISIALDGTVEWATPVLHLRSQDSTLFKLDYGRSIFPTPGGKPEPKPVPGPRHHPIDRQNLKGLQILLRKVQQHWIHGVLENSLYRALFIDLGMERLEHAVDDPWRDRSTQLVIERSNTEEQLLDSEMKIRTVFEEEGGSLLILGEPGSGKTTVMLNLVRDLLEQVSSDPTRPVPVVFNLSSWNPGYQKLTEWLVQELSQMYQVPKKVGRRWASDSRILPFLDGLDELEAGFRQGCVDTINHFTLEAGLVGSVVCCRLKEYTELPNRLNLNAAVRLVSLTDEQVLGYLGAASPHLDGLSGLLHRDSAFRMDARSPLMLGLMSRAYQDIPLDQLSAERHETAQMRRKQLMDAYIARMYQRAGMRRGM